MRLKVGSGVFTVVGSGQQVVWGRWWDIGHLAEDGALAPAGSAAPSEFGRSPVEIALGEQGGLALGVGALLDDESQGDGVGYWWWDEGVTGNAWEFLGDSKGLEPPASGSAGAKEASGVNR